MALASGLFIVALAVGGIFFPTAAAAQTAATALWMERCNAAGTLPIFDAHSQFDQDVPEDLVLARMREHGVIGTILSTRGRRHPREAAAFAEGNPDAILAAASTKQSGHDPLPLLGSGRFGSAAEILLFHARKGNRAPEVRIAPDDVSLQPLYGKIVEMQRPLILHIEFSALEPENRPQYETGLGKILRTYAATPVGLIHMAQLDAAGAKRWLSEHPNLFFIMSHADSLAARSRQPWTNMFAGDKLQPQWRSLIEERPDRFVFAMDNVWAEHWRSDYSERIALWRKTFASFPAGIARQLACTNAVRLWRLR